MVAGLGGCRAEIEQLESCSPDHLSENLPIANATIIENCRCCHCRSLVPDVGDSFDDPRRSGRTRVAMREAAETVMLDSIRSTIDSIASEGGELSSQAIESVGRIIKPRPGSGVESSTKPGWASRPEDASGSSIIGDLFRAGQQIAREIDDSIQDSVKLTSDEEIELGKRLHQSIIRSGKPVDDKRLDEMLKRLSTPFLSMRKRTDLPIQFTVMDSSDVNAFAHVGGFIYVNRGLIEFLAGDSELAFVLGHEIAHVESGHCSRQATIVALARELGGDEITPVAQMAYGAIAAGYSEEMELEADAWSYQAMPKGRLGALNFLDRLAGLDMEPSANQSNDPLGIVISRLHDHFATHPRTRLRIDALLAMESE